MIWKSWKIAQQYMDAQNFRFRTEESQLDSEINYSQ